MTVRWTVRAAEDRARSSRETESLEVHQKKNEATASFFFIQAVGLVWHHTLVCMELLKAYGITKGGFSTA